MASSKFKGLRAAIWCRYVFSRLKVSDPSVLEHRYKKGDEAHPVTSKITNESKLVLVEDLLAIEGVPWNAYYNGEILPSDSSLLLRKLNAAFPGSADFLENGPSYLFKVLTATKPAEAIKFCIHGLIDYIDDHGETSANFINFSLRDESLSLNHMLELCDIDWVTVLHEMQTRLPSGDVLLSGLNETNEDVFNLLLMYALVYAQFTTDDKRYFQLDKLLFDTSYAAGIKHFEQFENIPKHLWFAEPFMVNALKVQSKIRTFSLFEKEYFSEFLR